MKLNLARIKEEVAVGLFGGRIGGHDAPDVIATIERMAYLLGRLKPAACACDIEGPDGIECLRCEVDAVMPAPTAA